jgi:NAD(P)-dependent dehydrogenase (short-subunit alcohol dehydrogenase family)
MSKVKVALVTGANRGIGYEVVKQLASQDPSMVIILGARDEAKGQEAVASLRALGYEHVVYGKIDASDVETITSLANEVDSKYGKLDILINNAGGNYDNGVTALQTDPKFMLETMALNLVAPLTVIQKFMPLLKKSSSARIVNVSSGAGSRADPNFGLTSQAGITSYSLSKLALNGLTVKLAQELKETGDGSKILVNSVCPNFTATWPGAEAYGARPVADGAASVVWAALIPDDGPTGGFFRDGQPIGW